MVDPSHDAVDAATVAYVEKAADKGPRLCGVKELAAHLGGLNPSTVIAYSRLAEDPLPLRIDRAGAVWCFSLFVDQWRARRCDGIMPDGTALARATGQDAICAELGGVDRDTSLRWAKRPQDRLPIYGIKRGDPGGSKPWAYVSAIRDWLSRGDMPYQAHAKRKIPRVTMAWEPSRRLSIQRNAA
jgi:hypothetical protein